MAQTPTSSSRQLALVTGASSGVGLDPAAAELRTLGAHVESVQVDLAMRDGVERPASRF